MFGCQRCHYRYISAQCILVWIFWTLMLLGSFGSFLVLASTSRTKCARSTATEMHAYLEHVGDRLEAPVWMVREPSWSRGCMHQIRTRNESVNDDSKRNMLHPKQTKGRGSPENSSRTRNGSKYLSSNLPMLRRTTAPAPSCCGRARNLLATCRGFFTSIVDIVYTTRQGKAGEWIDVCAWSCGYGSTVYDGFVAGLLYRAPRPGCEIALIPLPPPGTGVEGERQLLPPLSGVANRPASFLTFSILILIQRARPSRGASLQKVMCSTARCRRRRRPVTLTPRARTPAFPSAALRAAYVCLVPASRQHSAAWLPAVPGFDLNCPVTSLLLRPSKLPDGQKLKES